jgi:hypothetical protein
LFYSGTFKLFITFSDKSAGELCPLSCLEVFDMPAPKVQIEFEEEEKPKAAAPKPKASVLPEVDLEFHVVESKSQAKSDAEAKAVAEAPSAHYKLGDEIKRLVAENHLLAAEVEAQVRLAVAERLVELKLSGAQEAKLLEHKVVKLIQQAFAKAPAVKAELLQIKKLVEEHAKPSGATKTPQPPVKKVA